VKFSKELWAHQKEAIERFATRDAAALLWDVGTGKTTATVGILRAKYNIEGRILRTLIITKTAVMFNWAKEFKNNSPESVYKTVSVIYGEGGKKLTGAKRIKMLADKEKKIFIINYEALIIKGFVEALGKFDIIVADESQAIKNPRSKRLEKLLKISDFASSKVALTGTPILRDHQDIWAQWRFLDNGRTFGRNFFVFRATYFHDKNAGMPSAKYFPNWAPKPGCGEKIAELMDTSASRKEKKDCLTLPPVLYIKEDVALSEEQQRLYDQMEGELVAYVKGEEATATNALVKVLRLLQITTGHLKLDNDEMVTVKDNPRLARLRELLEELLPGNKVVIWTVFRETYKDIINLCKDLGVGYAMLTGDTTDRQGEIDRFQADENCRVFIGNPRAGGVGVDGLQKASSYAIYYSRGYALEDRLQSEGRTNRGGSEIHDKITYIDLVSPNTIDEAVLSALQKKENYAADILTRLRG